MKRAATTLLILLFVSVASVALTSNADAALRSPQIPVLGGSLQAYLNSVGESINVNTDQDATQTWSHTSSGTTTYTIMLESSPNAAVNAFGMYNGGAVAPPLYLLVTGPVIAQGFSTATFKPGNIVTVNRFDDQGGFLSTNTYGGVDPTNFGFYLSTPNGTVYTQDARNPGGNARALVYKGTGVNAGTWWLCWDEPLSGAAGDRDFNDSVILMESVNPTPVSKTTWGTLKARFR